jgi:EmrB/QacA subfamily drug resistance transporter
MTAALTGSHPFRALWAMMVGFFLIVVDSTVVAVANPVIKQEFDVNYDSVIWVTSAYLLVFAVCLLVGGRLGDQFGPKNVYLLGLALFTASSLWCGLSGSIGMLIAARAAQGIGAALLTPQTLSTITRTFPPERHGVAMSLWGATAGVGMFAGPLAGGVLVDGLGWQWIFLINVPIGVAGFVLAVLLIPDLPGQRHRLDVLGVLLSAAGIGLIVFGLQEGQNHEWAWSIWGVIATGLGLLAAFVGWQAVQRREPLIPLTLFRHRDFSLSNAGIALVSFAFVAFAVPLMFYLQEVCGLSPTRSALTIAPMAIATAVLAPIVGWMVDRAHPRPIVGFGFAMLAISLLWLSLEMTPTTPVWRLVLPLTLMGAAGAFTWEPLAVTASRTLPPDLAGAGSAVYNTVRQVGAVLSSASVAALMAWLLGTEPSERAAAPLPDALKEPFADAMSQSMLLPAFAAVLGAATALFLVGRPQPAAARVATSRYRPGQDMRAAL